MKPRLEKTGNMHLKATLIMSTGFEVYIDVNWAASSPPTSLRAMASPCDLIWAQWSLLRNHLNCKDVNAVLLLNKAAVSDVECRQYALATSENECQLLRCPACLASDHNY